MGKQASRSFRYQPRTREDLKERANARGGGFDSFIKSKYKLYKVRDGKNLIRILPASWEKARHYGYDIWVNYGIGVDNQSYLSLSKMKGERDPIEEARREAGREGDEKLVKDLAPRQRILMWVIDRNDEDEGPQIWAAPVTVDKDIANISIDEETGEMIAIDLEDEGRDLRFFKEGTGLNTKYPGAKMRLLEKSPIHEDEKLQNQWLDYIADNPLPDCLQFYDYDHISSAFDGQVRSSDDEDKGRGRAKADRDEEPERRSRAAASRDDDGDEERRPARRSKERDSDDDDEVKAEVKPRRQLREEADSPTESITARLARRRQPQPAEADDDDEPTEED